MVEDFKLRCIDPVFYGLRDDGTYKIIYPCGKCVVCLERKRRQWAGRMEMESLYCKSCYFLTLTYSDEHLPMNYDIPTLSKVHYTNFLKRLRNYVSFRFYGVGEYGSESNRPHYHFLMFFEKPIKRELLREYVSKCWKYGFNTLKNGNVPRMYYIAKYCCKLGGSPLGALKSFNTCSQNPPIGYRYFQDNITHFTSDILQCTSLITPSNNHLSLPRSFEFRFRDYLASIPHSDCHDSILDKRVKSIRKRSNQRMAEYARRFNELPKAHYIEMCDTISRRYKKKHQKSQI